jgi:hypothetical protein
MTTHRVHDEGGDFYIRKNGSNFYLNTFGIGGGSGTPGPVASFSYGTTGESICTDNDVNFNWSAPLDDGGSPVTGYVIRRIGTEWINDTVYFSGDPTQAGNYTSNEFIWLCASAPEQEVTPINPLVLGNITSVDFSGVACGQYSYQIAAVNVNGTGTYYPSSPSDLLISGLGYLISGPRGYNVTNRGEGSVTLYYYSSPYNLFADTQECPAGSTFGGVTSNLYEYGNSIDIVDTYSSSDPTNAGQVFFDGQSPGIYYATIVETWYTEEYQPCTVQKHACYIPFEITS